MLDRGIAIRTSAAWVGAFITCCALVVNGASAATAKKLTTKNSSTNNATDNALDIRLVRSKVVPSSGKESLQNASTAMPGDILQDAATYTNKSSRVLRGVEATLPVPANTELLPNTVTPADARVSLDGLNFFAIPMTRRVKQANGVEIEQPVVPIEYRYLRWYPGELSPGQSMLFSAQFRVVDGSADRDGGDRNLKK